MTNFLRSSSSSSNTHNAVSLPNGAPGPGSSSNSGSNTNLHTVASSSALLHHNPRSFDISSPSDFQHCFSIQPELLSTAVAATLKQQQQVNHVSTPSSMDEAEQRFNFLNSTAVYNAPNGQGHALLSPVASPSLRLKIMLPSADKRYTNEKCWSNPN